MIAGVVSVVRKSLKKESEEKQQKDSQHAEKNELVSDRGPYYSEIEKSRRSQIPPWPVRQGGARYYYSDSSDEVKKGREQRAQENRERREREEEQWRAEHDEKVRHEKQRMEEEKRQKKEEKKRQRIEKIKTDILNKIDEVIKKED